MTISLDDRDYMHTGVGAGVGGGVLCKDRHDIGIEIGKEAFSLV